MAALSLVLVLVLIYIIVGVANTYHNDVYNNHSFSSIFASKEVGDWREVRGRK